MNGNLNLRESNDSKMPKNKTQKRIHLMLSYKLIERYKIIIPKNIWNTDLLALKGLMISCAIFTSYFFYNSEKIAVSAFFFKLNGKQTNAVT